jgi:shikimate kinase
MSEPSEAQPVEPPLTAERRPIVLVGLMGAGKSAVGRRLAVALGRPFRDADDAIVAAAGMSIPDIFELYGEPAFRDLERRVVARLLDEAGTVIALGGGAFIDPETRALVKRRALSIWIDADLDTLVERTARKPGRRPLLAKGDPREILARLMEIRYPIYAEADFRVKSGEGPVEAVVQKVLDIVRLAETETEP